MAAGLVIAVRGARLPRRTASPPWVLHGSVRERMIRASVARAPATFSATVRPVTVRASRVQQRQDLVHHGRHSAGGMEVGHVARRGRVHLGHVRRGARQLFQHVHRDLPAIGLVGDGRDVQGQVRRSADRRAQAEGVLDAPGD